MTLRFSLCVNKEEFDASQEVRDFWGELGDDFSGVHTDTEATLDVSCVVEMLNEPPMVISTRFRSISGPASHCVFK